MKKKKVKIITVANQKGGVGKTTTVFNLAAGIAKCGKSVLVVDLDYQANLTSRCLGWEHDGKPTIAELIVSSVGNMIIDYKSHIRHFEEGFDFIPAFDESLEGIPSYLAGKNNCMNILKKIFSNDYFNKYDFVILDCSPSSDLLVTNALSACDKLLIPVQTDIMSYDKVEKTLQTLVNIKQDTDIEKHILGFLPTMYQKGTKHSKEVYEALKESYGDLVFAPISYHTEVKNSVGNGKSSVNNPHSISGMEYMSIVGNILKMEDF